MRMKSIFPIGDFTRMLAKIGYSLAVAQLGIDTFQPAVLNLINGTDMIDGPHWVGGSDEYVGSSQNAGKDLLHDIWLSFARHPGKPTELPLIVACIQLFACFNMPVYQVVVGRSFQPIAQ